MAGVFARLLDGLLVALVVGALVTLPEPESGPEPEPAVTTPVVSTPATAEHGPGQG